jgi:peptide/nickel transport system permease protein
LQFIAKRLVQLVVVLLTVSFLTYLLLDLLPGDPTIAIAGPAASLEERDEIREDLGLNDALPVRYVRWLGDAVTGDLGDSYVTKVPVTEYLRDRLPLSLQLMVYAQILALTISVPLGIATAYRADSWFDRGANTSAFALLSVPNFIVGVLLVYFFAVGTGWFPAIGNTPFRDDPVEHFRSMFLPSLTLALPLIAVYTRLLRTDMIATLQEDFIGMAKAKGLPTWHILLRHALRPSSFSLLTVTGISIGNLIGGALIVERIFGLQGVGDAIVRGIFQRDYLIVQGGVVIVCIAFVVINFTVDMAYALLDPRIRHARANA